MRDQNREELSAVRETLRSIVLVLGSVPLLFPDPPIMGDPDYGRLPQSVFDTAPGPPEDPPQVGETGRSAILWHQRIRVKVVARYSRFPMIWSPPAGFVSATL